MTDSPCIVNQSCIGLIDKCPKDILSGKKPALSDFRIYICIFFLHFPKEKRTKLDEKSKEIIMIEFTQQSETYKLFDPEIN